MTYGMAKRGVYRCAVSGRGALELGLVLGPSRGIRGEPESAHETCACQNYLECAWDSCATFIHYHSFPCSMETYTKARELASHPGYDDDRREALEGLRLEISKGSIDRPILDILERFVQVPYCYTLQSCFGHFMREWCAEDSNTMRVAAIEGAGARLHYRIAYIALCIQNSAQGRTLHDDLRTVPRIDPDFIQFGSADWFWNNCANSYILQVSPLKNACQDHFDVSVEEALHIEDTRDRFFERVRETLTTCAYR
jgi:hypothetical protein